MLNENDFKEEMKDKLRAWDANYINYNSLYNKLEKLIEDNKDDIIKQKKHYDDFESNERETQTNDRIISFNKLTLNFISEIDNELNKSHIFFTKKERELYEQINLQYKVYKNPIINDEKRMEIAGNLVKLAQLARELKNYVYINVISLLRILYDTDNKLIDISYNYLQKHLTKNNGNFVYILNFKTMDESIVMIEEMFESIKNNLNESKYFKNNEEEKAKYKGYKKDIKEFLDDINSIHQKIFIELRQWERYLNISLGLPTSSNNSIFKNTDFIGDTLLYSRNTSNKKTKRLNLSQDDPEDNTIVDSFNVSFGVLFDLPDTFSYETKEVLSDYNLENIRYIYLLSGLYSYSYCFLIPDIMIYLLHNNGSDYFIFDSGAESSIDLKLYSYAFCISSPLIGNFISKHLVKKYIHNSYKKLLIVSLACISLYYLFSFLGLMIMEIFAKIDLEERKHRIKFDIYLILLGRILLGVSYLKQLCKAYIDIYVPVTNQVEINQRITIITYAGYIIALLLNCLHFFNWGLDEKIFENTLYCSFIMFGLSLNYSMMMLIFVFYKFKEPTESDYEPINENLIELCKEHRLSKGYIIDQQDKTLAQLHDDNYTKANNLIELSQTNALLNFIKENKDNFKNKYYNKIFFILLLSLFTSQYISENLLLLLPRFMTYNSYEISIENKDLFLYFPILLSLTFALSYLAQRFYLKYTIFHKFSRLLLIIINIFMILFSFDFVFLCINPKLFAENRENDKIYYLLIFPSFGYFFIVFLNELHHIICINLFMNLLPTENISFLGFQASSWLNMCSKIARIIPSILIIIFLRNWSDENEDNYNNIPRYTLHKLAILINEDYDEYYFNFHKNVNLCGIFLFGTQIILLITNLIFSILYLSHMKIRSRNRILNLK